MSYTFKGKWKWNNVVYPLMEGDSYYIECEFVSNGRNIFCIAYDEGDDSQHARVGYLRYDDGINIITVAQNPIDQGPGVCVYDEWRVMDFGEGCVIENEEYCEFLLANIHELTMSEKLKLIVENEQRVYNSGYGAGKEAEYDAFWDACQVNGTRTNYRTGFGWASWKDETFKPKYDIKPKNAYGVFTGTYIADIWGYLEKAGVKLDTSEATDMSYVCSEIKYCPRIGELDFRKATASTGAFYYSNAIETIDKIIVNENNVYSSWFTGCTKLKNIKFEGVIGNNINISPATLLSRASIESIVNHLSDTVSGKTLTLSKAAVINAFGGAAVDTDGDGVLDAIMGSEEWLELAGNKTNWNFAFV